MGITLLDADRLALYSNQMGIIKVNVSLCFRLGDDKLELDFESNPADIINPEHYMVDELSMRRSVVASGPTPSYQKSLRVSLS